MKRKSALYGLLAALFWLLVWQGIAMLVGKPFLLPSPVETAGRLLSLLVTADFYATAGMSLFRILIGYVLGVAAGVLLALLTTRFFWAEQLLRPLRSVIRATPVSSIILLTLVWLTTGTVPVFIVFLMVLPIIWSNVETGIRQTDPLLLEMAKSFRLSRGRTLRRIYLPSVLPHFMDACITALGFAWKSGIAAEVLATPQLSIGTQLYESKIYLETPDLFAWTALVVILSFLLEKVLVRALRSLSDHSKAKKEAAA